MRRIKVLPLKRKGRYFLMRLEGTGDSGKKVWAEGLVQRPGMPRAVPLTALSMRSADINWTRTMLEMTLKTLAGERID